jgi:hypothetical protein
MGLSSLLQGCLNKSDTVTMGRSMKNVSAMGRGLTSHQFCGGGIDVVFLEWPIVTCKCVVKLLSYFSGLWENKPLLLKRHVHDYYDGIFSTDDLERILREVQLNDFFQYFSSKIFLLQVWISEVTLLQYEHNLFEHSKTLNKDQRLMKSSFFRQSE